MQSPLRSLPEPLELETLSRYLKTLGYEHHRVDEAQRFVVVRVRGKNGIYDLFLLPRGKIVHLQIPKLFALSAGEHGSTQLTRLLLELNWQNLVGKYSWDPGDGEVRFSYSHLVPGGIGFDGFSFAVAQCLATVDADMPRLQKFYERVRGQPGTGADAVKVKPGERPAQGVRRP